MGSRTPLFVAIGLLTGCLLAGQALAQCEVLDLHGPSVWQEGSQYGCSVDLDGNRMAIGQYLGAFDWVTGGEPGLTYLFRREPFGWVPDGTVQASDGEEGDYFGWSVALDGDRLLVGVPAIGYLGAKGAAYVFERQGEGLWIETAKLLPDEPQAFAIGWSVDLEGDTAIVGAKGASIGLGWGRVYVYERVGATWILKQEILPSFSQAGDAFGVSVDLQGDRLVVGASDGWTFNPPYPGRAFVFEKQGGVWAQTTVLAPDDLEDGDLFGSGVALDGDTILVGAPGYDLGGQVNEGAAYSFDLVAGFWVATQTIPGEIPTSGLSTGMFGWAVELEGNLAVVGSRDDPTYATWGGAASFFDRAQGSWAQVSKFVGSGVKVHDTFGYCVDLEGDEILIGAPNAGSGTSPGAAYLFSLDPDLHLLADAESVSLAQGGDQTFSLGACATHTGDLYFLAGSATGTFPGFAFAGLPVPLNPDVYFFYTVNHPGTTPLAASFGFFDTFGTAEASFALPAGTQPALAGLTLNHAYAVLDAATLQLEAVSPAVPVTLLP